MSTALEWTLLLTAEHPLEQARARAHALRLPATAEVPYVRALTRETLRAKPPLLIPRLAVRDSSIGGHFVPRGHIVYANHWSLAHSEKHWLLPSAFRPERWLLEESGYANSRGPAMCKFIPFSIGQRACPGAKLAEAELSAATHVLLRAVRWSKVAPLVRRRGSNPGPA